MAVRLGTLSMTLLALASLGCAEDMREHLSVHDVQIISGEGLPIVVGPHASVSVGTSHRVAGRVTNDHRSRSAWVHELRVELFEDERSTTADQWLEHSWVSELRDIGPGEEVRFEVRLGLSSERMNHCNVLIVDASDSAWH